MKKKTLFKLILIVVFFAGLWGVLSYYNTLNKSGNILADKSFGWKYPTTKFPIVGPITNQIAYSSIRDPGGIPQGLPVRLQVPVIGVDTAIEDALITPDGRMDVPAGSTNVAWFALGPHPGQQGSAVIGGHFGISNGVKFVFYDLDKLKIGDRVYILDDKGNTLAFQVRSISLFDRNADATTVFTSTDGFAHLNLITCEGIWNQVNGNYPQRRVVFTDAIPGEGAAPTSLVPTRGVIIPTGVTPTVTATTPVSPVFNRSLRIGTKGSDVKILQTILEQNKFFLIASGIADGIFGAKTRSAVAKFQTSVGLQSDGVFGPITISRFINEFATTKTSSPVAVGSRLPSTGIINPGSSSFLQTLVASFQNLFSTPINAVITSFFIILIVFLSVKMILLL